jgi:hypothetical protein
MFLTNIQVACLAEHDDGKEVTLYCQHSEIAVEMDRYCTLARDLICDGSVDVFMKVLLSFRHINS